MLAILPGADCRRWLPRPRTARAKALHRWHWCWCNSEANHAKESAGQAPAAIKTEANLVYRLHLGRRQQHQPRHQRDQVLLALGVRLGEPRASAKS